VPEFALDPGDPSDEAVRIDDPKDLPGARIDLMDLAIPVYNHRRGGHALDAAPAPNPVLQIAATCGTDAATLARDRARLSAFALEDGVVLTPTRPPRAGWTASGACTNGSTARRRRNETGQWFRRNDEYHRN